MSLRTGNATRDRILADRDAFRDGWQAEQQQKQQQNTLPEAPAAQSPVHPQAQPQTQSTPAPQPVPVSDIPVPDDFIKSVDNMGKLNVEPQQPQENPEIKAMREENAKLQKELEELRKARETDSASLAELNKLREKQRVDEYLAGMDGLNSVNADDARKLVAPLLQQMDKAREDSAKQLQEARAAIEQRFTEMDKRKAQDKNNQIYSQIIKAHPDLQQLQKTKEYSEVMLSPVQPNSNITVGELVAAELKNGNADYIIKVLDTVKQRSAVPNINAVASVSGSATAGAATGTDTTGDILTDEQIADLRFKVQTGEISRDEFRARMARHREASKLHNRK